MAADWGAPQGPPRTLEELYVKAKDDLIALRPGVLLEWAFLHSRAVGRLEAARAHLATIEAQERDFRFRLTGLVAMDEATGKYISEHSIGASGMDALRRQLEEGAACVRATEHVMALLDRAGRKRAADKAQGQQLRPRAA